MSAPLCAVIAPKVNEKSIRRQELILNNLLEFSEGGKEASPVDKSAPRWDLKKQRETNISDIGAFGSNPVLAARPLLPRPRLSLSFVPSASRGARAPTEELLRLPRGRGRSGWPCPGLTRAVRGGARSLRVPAAPPRVPVATPPPPRPRSAPRSPGTSRTVPRLIKLIRAQRAAGGRCRGRSAPRRAGDRRGREEGREEGRGPFRAPRGGNSPGTRGRLCKV